MGGKAGGKIRITKYFANMHYGICEGPVDEIVDVYMGERKIPNVAAARNKAINVNRQGFFGGPKKEGGIAGTIWMLLGGPEQVLPAHLISKLDPNGTKVGKVPHFRRLCSIFLTDQPSSTPVFANTDPYQEVNPWWGSGADFSGILQAIGDRNGSSAVTSEKPAFYLTANNPYLKGLSARIRRVPQDWYTATNTISWTQSLGGGTSTVRKDANPIHCIREIQTNAAWGCGMAPSLLDDASFRAAAERVYNEGLGVSFKWVKSSDASQLIDRLLQIVDGVLFSDLSTGKVAIRLNRGGYNQSTLTRLDETNCTLEDVIHRDISDTFNEVVLTYTDPRVENPIPVTVQDVGNINAQGGFVNSTTVNYPMIRRPLIAERVANRELLAATAPLIMGSLLISPELYRQCTPGNLFLLNFPKRDLNDVVIRIGNPDVSGGEKGIPATFVEDVYARTGVAVDDTDLDEYTDDVVVAQEPAKSAHERTLTMPFAFAKAKGLVGSSGSSKAFAVVLASTSQEDCYGFDVYDSSVNRIRSEVVPTGRANLVAAMVAESLSELPAVTKLGLFSEPQDGDWWLIGNQGNSDLREIAQVVETTEGVRLRRGMLDTIPQNHEELTSVWQIDAGLYVYDTVGKEQGESVSYKLITKTSLGSLDLDDADSTGVTLTSRAQRPLRPANVRVGGVAFTTEATPVSVPASGVLAVTWSRRNRLLEDVNHLNWNEADVPPEAGQVTAIRVRNSATGANTYFRDFEATSASLDLGAFDAGQYEVFVYSSLGSEDSVQGLTHYIQIT